MSSPNPTARLVSQNCRCVQLALILFEPLVHRVYQSDQRRGRTQTKTSGGKAGFRGNVAGESRAISTELVHGKMGSSRSFGNSNRYGERPVA